MRKSRYGLLQLVLVPSRVPFRPKKCSALVVVHTVDFPAELRKVDADFGTDEPGRAGDEEFFHFMRQFR